MAEMCCENVECPDGVERGAYGDERSGGHRGTEIVEWHKSDLRLLIFTLPPCHRATPAPDQAAIPAPCPRVISPPTRCTRRDARGIECCPSQSTSPFSPPSPFPSPTRDAATATATAGQRRLRDARPPAKAHPAPRSKLASHHRRHLRRQAWHPARRTDGLAERWTSRP